MEFLVLNNFIYSETCLIGPPTVPKKSGSMIISTDPNSGFTVFLGIEEFRFPRGSCDQLAKFGLI